MERKMNTCAVVGFILSFFCGFAGLIISIIALSQIKKTGEKGKGLAVAGVVVSLIGFVISLLFLIPIFFTSLVWPDLTDSIASSQVCNNRPGITIGRYGEPGYVSCTSKSYDGTYVCNYTDGDGRTTAITCSTSAS